MWFTGLAVWAWPVDHAAVAGEAVAAFALGQLVGEAEDGFAFGELAARPEGGLDLTHGGSEFSAWALMRVYYIVFFFFPFFFLLFRIVLFRIAFLLGLGVTSWKVGLDLRSEGG